MSIISNRHNVNPFVAGKSEALNGQRLAKVGYKSSKANPAKYKSVCVSVPPMDKAVWNTPELIARLESHFNAVIESAQDGIIRSLYESSDGELSSVSDDELNIDAVINFLDAESTGGRLTIEVVNQWFDSQVRDNLTVVIATKLGFDLSTPEQESTVQKHVAGYRGLFASLSGGKTFLQPTQIAGIRRALEVSSVDDEISVKLMARLIQREKKPNIAELLLLD